jgi:EAL domain-containing protein (putative c-di-GMP-specific phosphodiesterase class I)
MFRCLVPCEAEPTRRVALARATGRRTVAEFVPDQETLELLAELGVDLAQGFHVGRPRPLEEL